MCEVVSAELWTPQQISSDGGTCESWTRMSDRCQFNLEWGMELWFGRWGDSQPSVMGWFSRREPWIGADIHHQISWCFFEQVNQISAQKYSFCSSYWYFSLDILLRLGFGMGIRISQNITSCVLFSSGAAGGVQQSHNPDILISSFEAFTVWGF